MASRLVSQSRSSLLLLASAVCTSPASWMEPVVVRLTLCGLQRCTGLDAWSPSHTRPCTNVWTMINFNVNSSIWGRKWNLTCSPRVQIAFRTWTKLDCSLRISLVKYSGTQMIAVHTEQSERKPRNSHIHCGDLMDRTKSDRQRQNETRTRRISDMDAPTGRTQSVSGSGLPKQGIVKL